MIDATIAALVREDAESRREALVALCTDLVAARSVNPPGDTRDVARVVLDAITALGQSASLVHAIERMPSVLARLDSGRPGRHLVLNVHLDTMPPGDEDAWTVPIWKLTRRDGRLWGLGMGNMKGAVAAMIHAFGMLADRRDSWAGSITFTAVSDEVVFGPHGAAHLLATLPGLLGDGMICGEGAGFRRLAIGEKGVLWLELRASGDPGHSSSVLPGRSASARIARAITAVDSLTASGHLPADLVIADPERALALTANVGTVVAGTFIGQVATDAVAEVDLRLPPGITIDQAQELVEAAIASASPEQSVTVRRIKGWDPAVTDPASAIVSSWGRAEAAAGEHPAPFAVRLPASDASRWRSAGTDAICFGPQPTLSAGIDDYADEDEVVRCAMLYTLTALDFLSSERTDAADVTPAKHG